MLQITIYIFLGFAEQKVTAAKLKKVLKDMESKKNSLNTVSYMCVLPVCYLCVTCGQICRGKIP